MYLILPPPLLSPKAAAPPPQPGPKVQAAFCLLYWPPCSLWGSWARGQTRAAVVTCATAAPAPDPFTRCTGPGREPAPWRCRDTSDPVVPQGELPGNFFFFFLGLHLWHMEVPRRGVELELPLSVYTTAAATPDLSHVCDLHHCSRQCWILNPLTGARDRTCILTDTPQATFFLNADLFFN